MSYQERLNILDSEPLHVKRNKYDSLMCCKIICKQVIMHTNDILIFADSVMTRGHKYKLFKCYSGAMQANHVYVNSLCNVWHSLPETVVEASSVAVFR